MWDEIEWVRIQHHDTWEKIRIYSGLATIPFALLAWLWIFCFKRAPKIGENTFPSRERDFKND